MNLLRLFAVVAQAAIVLGVVWLSTRLWPSHVALGGDVQFGADQDRPWSRAAGLPRRPNRPRRRPGRVLEPGPSTDVD
jgi:hypothetical protein